jgi:hypothetical protein
MGQPAMQIVLGVVCEKGPIVLMVNKFSSEYLHERDDVFVGDHRRGDALLRLRSGPSLRIHLHSHSRFVIARW